MNLEHIPPFFHYALLPALLAPLLATALSHAPARAAVSNAGSLSAAPAAADAKGVTVYYGGPIYPLTEDYTRPSTLDPATAHQVEVVAAKDGVIVFTGTRAEAEKAGYFAPGGAACLTDLKGDTMLPGFVDGHGHFPVQGAADLYQVDLSSPPVGRMSSIEDYVKALKDKAATARPGEWIVGWGYDDTLIKDQRHPTREDLDKVSTTQPVVAKHVSAHFMVANSKAFELSGVPENAIPPGGLLDDTTMGLVNIPPATTDQREADALMSRAIARASAIYAAQGVTTADQGGGLLHPLDRGFTLDEKAAARLAEEEVAKLELRQPLDARTREAVRAETIARLKTAMETALSDQVRRWPVEHSGAGHLFEFQQAVHSGDLPIRVIVHPLGGDVMGEINRDFLGWKSSGPYENLPVTQPLGKADVKTPQARTVGDDLTNYKRPGGVPELPDNRLLMGSWKLFLDGSIQGYTGWLKDPGYYDREALARSGHDAGWRGGEYDGNVAAMRALFARYHLNGEPFEVHGNGNMAAEAIVRGLEEVVAQAPVTDMRHSIIHGQMLERGHIARMMGRYDDPAAEGGAEALRAAPELPEKMRAQHFVNNFFINHAYYWGDRHLDTFMGPGRGKNMSPAGWSVAYDQPFALHNDTPVTPISPLRSVQSAVTRRSAPTPTSVPPRPGGALVSGSGHDLNATADYPATVDGNAGHKVEGPETAYPDFDQRVNVLQALHGVTTVPAYQNHVEDRIGSIAPGKLADFVILGKNPFEVARNAPDTLADIPVIATIVGGKTVYGTLPSPCVKP